MADSLDTLKAKLTAKKKRGNNEPDWDLGLSTGCTLLNLACSGRIDIGFAPNNYYCWCGRSGSGKTFITMTTLAEASINPRYDKHRLIFDCPEHGALMSIEKFFGPALARRLEPPAGTRDKPRYSRTLEGLYHNVHNALSIGPCIYLLDSMDPLPTDTELKAFLKKNRAYNKKEKKTVETDGAQEVKEAGSYGTERAKVNSHHLRLVFNELQGSGSMFIVIFQSRQNIGPGAVFNPDVRGGGNAPTFYAGMELWSSVHTHLKVKEKVSGKSVEQGVVCKVRIKKGRIQGKDRTVYIPIYHTGDAPGIDDVGGCVDFMAEWKRWPKTGKDYDVADGKIDAVDFKINANREKVVQHILANNLEDDLKQLVLSTWKDIEDNCAVHRKPRYGQQIAGSSDL